MNGRCEHTELANYTPCAGVDVCAYTGECFGGLCYPSGHSACDDGDPCTDDLCLTSGVCERRPVCVTTTTTTSTTTTTLGGCG